MEVLLKIEHKKRNDLNHHTSMNLLIQPVKQQDFYTHL